VRNHAMDVETDRQPGRPGNLRLLRDRRDDAKGLAHVIHLDHCGFDGVVPGPSERHEATLATRAPDSRSKQWCFARLGVSEMRHGRVRGCWDASEEQDVDFSHRRLLWLAKVCRLLPA
jgi:hypothetical protein